jgi:hypothetical protein
MSEHVTPKKETSRRPGGKEHSKDPSWKKREREAARFLQDHAGVDDDPVYQHLITSTGRVGHLSALQHDCSSRLYAGEVKEWHVAAKLATAWVQILQIAKIRHKEPILVLYLKNFPEFVCMAKKYKTPPMHCITPERHADLLAKEQELEAIQNEVTHAL